MNDDYLWDRSGEPDPEVDRLEQVLGKYRYQAKPLSPAVHSPWYQRRTGWIRVAAAAAAILIVCAAVWILKIQKATLPEAPGIADTNSQPLKPPPQPVKPRDEAAPTVRAAQGGSVAIAIRTPHRIHRKTSEEGLAEGLPGDGALFISERQPTVNPFIDVETARHIERAQLLLRSFRNTRDSGSRSDSDVSYERQGSRALLSNNVLLRRDAEAKGNLPVEELLGSLEPFLLDIANLPDKPSSDDVRAIKERMQKKEIVSALQIYSAPTLSQVF